MYSETVSRISAGSKNVNFPVLLRVARQGLSPLRREVAAPWTTTQGKVDYTFDHTRIQSMLLEGTPWEFPLQDSSRLGLALSDQGIEALFVSAGLYQQTVEKIMGRVIEGSIKPGQVYKTSLVSYELEGGLAVADFNVSIGRSPAWLLKISGNHMRTKPDWTGTLGFLQEMLTDEIGLSETASVKPPKQD